VDCEVTLIATDYQTHLIQWLYLTHTFKLSF